MPRSARRSRGDSGRSPATLASVVTTTPGTRRAAAESPVARIRRRTMKAAILPAFGQPLSIEDVPRPVPEADEVLIAVEACGVCHSDLHIADGDMPGFRAAAKPRLILGHEVVGRVVERGAAVTALAIGDRVGVPWIHAACGECEPCREGNENLCRRAVVTGMMVDGGYAELMRAKAAFALPVPASLTAAQAAPLFCA